MTPWDALIFEEAPFAEKKAAVFNYQLRTNPVYQRFCNALGGTHFNIAASDFSTVPLLPIQAFKNSEILSLPRGISFDACPSPLMFKSSGTSGMKRSIHRVADEKMYRQSVLQGFSHFYDLDNAVILGYTPGYAENPHSSLIWMINELINQDDIKKSRFLPLDKPLSQGEVDDINASGRQLILFGAAFGLLDLVDQSKVQLPSDSIIIETGGMKTHRREMNRKSMHYKLASGFGIDGSRVHSEYGMCELLSQAYATGGEWFRTVPWMEVSIRDPDDPQRLLEPYQEGLIGVIDLANVYSCSFVLTGDRGVMDARQRFKVLGRWNPKDLRGCNFLIDED